MATLFKAVKRSPKQKPEKHEKLGDGWGEHQERVVEGMTFYMKYLGSTLVEELDDGQSYGDVISARAVNTIVAMARSSGKKQLPKVAVVVSPNNIRVTDLATKEVLTDLTIYRISFCTADKTNDKVFAYIARNMDNETMECHAFLSAKRKIAQAVALTVAQAFQVAQSQWELKEQKERENMERKAFGDDGKLVNGHDRPAPAIADLLNLGQDSFFGSTTTQQSLPTRPDRLGFEDNFTEIDEFARLAESRSKKANPYSGFRSGVCEEDIDDGVMQIVKGQAMPEELVLTPSVDDLLGL